MSVFLHDVSITSPAQAWYAIKAQAIRSSLGGTNWTLRTSGSGTGGVYSQAGDVIVSAATLATDLAWFVLRGHGVTDSGVVYRRELCVQISQPSGDVRITYSAREGFVTGAPSPSRVPTATDGVLVHGGGTDAAPTFAALLPAAGAWLDARFSEVDDSVWIMAYPTGGGLPTALIFLEPTRALYRTGGELVDHDPIVIYARAGADCATWQALCAEATGPLGWLALITDPVRQLWGRTPLDARCAWDGAAWRPVLPAGLPASPQWTTPVYAQEVGRYARRVGLSGAALLAKEAGNLNTTGDKGEGLYLRLSGTRFATPTVLDDVDPSSGASMPRNILAAGDLQLPWELAASVAQ